MDLKETRDATCYLDFMGETRRFKIGLAELARVQDDCQAGPFVIAEALARAVLVLEQGVRVEASAMTILASGLGPAKIEYVRAPILHGLMGGGMAPEEAFKLVRRAIDERGLMALVEYAQTALHAITGAVNTPKEDPPEGESDGAAEKPAKPRARSPRSRTAASGSR